MNILFVSIWFKDRYATGCGYSSCTWCRPQENKAGRFDLGDVGSSWHSASIFIYTIDSLGMIADLYFLDATVCQKSYFIFYCVIAIVWPIIVIFVFVLEWFMGFLFFSGPVNWKGPFSMNICVLFSCIITLSLLHKTYAT
jgi:hypothetical protein